MELYSKDSRSEEIELTDAQQDENRSIVRQMEELGYIDVGLDI